MEDKSKLKYKLFFTDLDHTLIMDNHIPPFNLEAIKLAKEKGVKFILCTARSFKLMNHFLKELETENSEKEYSICNSGCTIYENKDQKLIYYKELDKELLNLIFEYAKNLNIKIIFNTLNDVSYIYNEEKTDKEKWMNIKHKAIKSIEELNDVKVIRLLFCSKDYNSLLNIKNEMSNNKDFEGKIDCYLSGKTMMEIHSIGVSKGEALKWLSNYLNVDIKETIAIGDDYSDESMIKIAGLGCAVKSAHDEIKNVSKYICEKDYFEGSVKEVIEKFILN